MMKALPLPLMAALAACNILMPVQAKPVPSVLFGDHAVLQRGVPVPVWGKASPGEKVTVTFSDHSASATADANGRWRAELPAMKAGEKGDLVMAGDQGTVTSQDVIVGDVWLCSGQSNIEWTVKKSDKLEEEKAAATHPEIRHFKVLPKTSDTPWEDPKGKWVVCAPDTVAEFTAIGYFFARDLLRESGVPQGLINSTKGGTRIEAWLNKEGLATDGSLNVITERWDKAAAAFPEANAKYEAALAEWKQAEAEAKKEGKPFTKRKPREPAGKPGSAGMPSSLYNAMVDAVLDYPVRAVVWYQGESNWEFPREYGADLRGLIRGWRQRAGREDLPFVVVQLPLHGGDDTLCWPILREGQATVARELPQTSLVVFVDLGDRKQIHPTNKQAFGERVGRVVRRDVLGEKVVASGPDIVSATAQGGAMHVKLGGEGKPVLKESPGTVGAFELAGADKVFHPAVARLEGGEIIVESAEVPEPVALRYAWRSGPTAILFNEEGLPAAPFRTDQWVDKK